MMSRQQRHALEVMALVAAKMKPAFEAADKRAKSGRELADEGIASSIEHAGPIWSEEAYKHLRRFAQTHSELAVEDVKEWAYLVGLPIPPAPGSWGAITRRAIRKSEIVFDHYRESKNASQHAKPVKVWRSRIYQQQF